MFKRILLLGWVSCFLVVSAQAQQAPAPEAEAVVQTQAAEPAGEQPDAPAAAEASADDTSPANAQDLEAAQTPAQAQEPGEPFVAPRESVEQPAAAAPKQEPKVVFNPKSQRDPTLSPDDFLLLQYREQQRLAALEAERQRKLAEERRKREEAERQRQLELARIKDPTREVRNRIKIGGIVGQEVFIGSKIYTVGNRIYGARIVEVRPDEVVFTYKGHRFVRKVQLNP